MNRPTIWKVPIPLGAQPSVPARVQVAGQVITILSAGVDPAGVLSLWLLVLPRPTHHEAVETTVLGTGHPFPPSGPTARDFVSTVVDPSGLVLHVFARKEA